MASPSSDKRARPRAMAPIEGKTKHVCTAAAGILLIAATPSCAKQQQPIELGRTHAIGGSCADILFAADQQHTLTIGDHGDLVWWDQTTRQPVLHVAGLTKHATAALHPTLPLAAVSWNDGHSDGSVHLVDLTTGAARQCLNNPATAMAFDSSGTRLGTLEMQSSRYRLTSYRITALDHPQAQPLWQSDWRPHETPIAHGIVFADGDALQTTHLDLAEHNLTAATSPNQQFTAHCKQHFVHVGEQTYTFDSARETWIERIRIADDGCLVVADVQGQLTMRGQDPHDRHLVAPHLGEPDRMVFSPDGSHLAIMTIGGMRVVDRSGATTQTFHGTHIALPGSAGAEFWIIARDAAWRWDASSHCERGERLVWPDQQPNLLRSPGNHSRFRTDQPFRIWRLGPALLDRESVWLACDDRMEQLGASAGGRAMRTYGLLSTPAHLMRIPGTSDQLLHTIHSDYICDRSSSYLRRLDEAGQTVATWHHQNAARWLAIGDSGDTAWTWHGYELIGIACRDLTEVAHHVDCAQWRHGIAWHGGTLLVITERELQVIDPMTLAVQQQFALPADLTRLDLLAASQDRSLLAIASGTEVRILRMR